MGATVFKKGKTWHYRFQVGGVRVQRSTHQGVKGRAEAIANSAYEAALARANGGQPVPTLRQLAVLWLEIHRPVASAHHVRSVEKFARLHLYDLGDKRIDDILTADVELARIEHLQGRSPATANHWLTYLKLLTMWAVKREILPRAPWQVKAIKVQKKPRPMLPLDVVSAWCAAVDQASAGRPAIGLAVRLMFGLGLRESEVITARWEWLDKARGQYTPGITKGREADALPVVGWLRDYLEPQRQAEGLIVCRPDGQAYASGFVRAAIARANAACRTKGISPHRLRGTCATLLAEEGVPIQTIQRMLRHKHYGTTMGYLEVNLGLAANALDRIGQKAGMGGAKVARETEESP